jgi:hypothetical protein
VVEDTAAKAASDMAAAEAKAKAEADRVAKASADTAAANKAIADKVASDKAEADAKTKAVIDKAVADAKAKADLDTKTAIEKAHADAKASISKAAADAKAKASLDTKAAVDKAHADAKATIDKAADAKAEVDGTDDTATGGGAIGGSIAGFAVIVAIILFIRHHNAAKRARNTPVVPPAIPLVPIIPQGGGGRRSSAILNYPRHWEGRPPTAGEIAIDIAEEEGLSIVERLQADIPGANVTRITRVQKSAMWMAYEAKRLEIGRGGHNWAAINERWLWHGTDALSEVVESGFNAFSYGNLDFNAYGLGNYFAPDAKLSDFFIRAQRGAGGGNEKRLILARVACGTIKEKQSLTSMRGGMQALLKMAVHRKAPDGGHSATGQGHCTEIIVYSDTQAYPAYVVTYLLPGGALPDPYAEQRRNPNYLRRHNDPIVNRWTLRGGRRVGGVGGGVGGSSVALTILNTSGAAVI